MKAQCNAHSKAIGMVPTFNLAQTTPQGVPSCRKNFQKQDKNQKIIQEL